MYALFYTAALRGETALDFSTVRRLLKPHTEKLTE
jgi:hypothetical protein